MRKFFGFMIGRDYHPHPTNEELQAIGGEFEQLQQEGKRLVLGIMPSRSGATWLCDIFNAHPNATGVLEREFEAASFYRYIKYNKLPIDTSGFIATVKYGVVQDWKKKGGLSLIFSPHFSHGIRELYDVLKPSGIIFALNDPEFTVQSMYNKGIFSEYYFRDNNNLAVGFQPAMAGSWSKIFGRLVPNGPFYDTWLGLTRIGKLSWWGNMLIMEMYRQLEGIPEEEIDIFHLKTADQNYEWYKQLAARYQFSPLLSERDFLDLKGKTVKKWHNVKREWSDQERAEFEFYTKDWQALYKRICLDGAGKYRR